MRAAIVPDSATVYRFDTAQGLSQDEVNTERPFNILKPRQKGHHFTDDLFKCIFLNENV